MQEGPTDNWDWPFILYVGRKWLGFTDEETMSLTPRYFRNQISVHLKVQKELSGNESKGNSKDTFGYIDQIEGW